MLLDYFHCLLLHTCSPVHLFDRFSYQLLCRFKLFSVYRLLIYSVVGRVLFELLMHQSLSSSTCKMCLFYWQPDRRTTDINNEENADYLPRSLAWADNHTTHN